MTQSKRHTLTFLQSLTETPEQSYAALQADCTKFRKDFEKALEEDPSLKDLSQYDDWYATADGQRTLYQITQRILSYMARERQERLSVGHDPRHLMFDTAAGLRIMMVQPLIGTDRCFLFASLLHDVGRLYEHYMPNIEVEYQRGWYQIHAELSYAFAKELFAQFDLPENVQNHILHAILVHSDLKAGATDMAGFVKRADREQIAGAEGNIRVFTDAAGVNHSKLNRPDHGKFKTGEMLHNTAPTCPHILHNIEFFCRNLFDNIGRYAKTRYGILKIQTIAFLWVAAGPDCREDIFAPELLREKIEDDIFDPEAHGFFPKKKLLDKRTFNLGRELAENFLKQNPYPNQKIDQTLLDLKNLLTKPGMLMADIAMEKITDCFKQADLKDAQAFVHALKLNDIFVARNETRTMGIFKQALQEPEPYIHLMARAGLRVGKLGTYARNKTL